MKVKTEFMPIRVSRLPANCLVLFITFLVLACEPIPPIGYISTDGTRFVDPAGREVLFHGVNMVNKDPRKNYTEVFKKDEIDSLAAGGFNVIRLGVIWSGIEPEPGLFDENYLKQIDQMVTWITEAGMYVLLDMHQDLYGQKFSDGAPDWATLDQNLPHLQGPVWSDSYMISPAVQTAFDNFWDNIHAPDKVGIQDHYILMWKMLAERYRDNKGIIGFDIMNEPFMGTNAQKVMPLMIQGYAFQMMDLEKDWKEGNLQKAMVELGDKWADEQGRLEILRTLTDPAIYAPVVESAAAICQEFESEILNPFYQKVRDAIRSVNTNHILFLEHNYFSNTGIESAIQVPKNESGENDPLIAYAAHGYDLVTDTKEVGSPAYGRIDYIFRQIKRKSESLNVPLFVGEWGAYGGNHPNYAETSAAVMSLFEEFKCSHTYWAYSDIDFSRKAYYPVLNRAYPAVISGRLNYYTYNHQTKDFIVEWESTGLEKYPSWIFFPDENFLDSQNIHMVPASKISIEKPFPGSGLFILIEPSRFAGKRKISYFAPTK